MYFIIGIWGERASRLNAVIKFVIHHGRLAADAVPHSIQSIPSIPSSSIPFHSIQAHSILPFGILVWIVCGVRAGRCRRSYRVLSVAHAAVGAGLAVLNQSVQ